jgi:hypothetical protein
MNKENLEPVTSGLKKENEPEVKKDTADDWSLARFGNLLLIMSHRSWMTS